MSRRRQACEEACLYFESYFKNDFLIASFASAGTEINLWPLNRQLVKEGRLVLPRIESERIQFYRVARFSDLKRNARGVLEPNFSNCIRCEASCIEAILIPGLGFEPQMHFRLGYGLGYYDRYLSAFPYLETFGVGFKEQKMQCSFQEAHDIPMKKILLF